jgi:hypothetical protein
VGYNGCIQLGKCRYYIQLKLKGRYIVLKLDAHQRALQVFVQNRCIKTLPIKGLHPEEQLCFDEYYQRMLGEARSEWQCYLQRARRQYARSATMWGNRGRSR